MVGAIIGDGNLWTDGRHYRVELTGDPELDTSYFQYLSKIIRTEFEEKPRSKVRQRGLRMRICSKKFFKYLASDLGIPTGSKKAKKVTIPKEIIKSPWKIKSKCIRGIVDSDGSFFFSKKNYHCHYPTIEITTISKNLAEQIENCLRKQGFRVGFRSWDPKREWNTRYVISINGEEMCKKWKVEIGFSNSRHYQKLNKNQIG